MPQCQQQIQFDLPANNKDLNGTQIATLTAVLSNVNLPIVVIYRQLNTSLWSIITVLASIGKLWFYQIGDLNHGLVLVLEKCGGSYLELWFRDTPSATTLKPRFWDEYYSNLHKKYVSEYRVHKRRHFLNSVLSETDPGLYFSDQSSGWGWSALKSNEKSLLSKSA